MPRKKKEKPYEPPKVIDLTKYEGNRKLYLIHHAKIMAEYFGYNRDQVWWDVTRGTLQDTIKTFDKYFSHVLEFITEDKPKKTTRKRRTTKKKVEDEKPKTRTTNKKVQTSKSTTKKTTTKKSTTVKKKSTTTRKTTTKKPTAKKTTTRKRKTTK